MDKSDRRPDDPRPTPEEERLEELEEREPGAEDIRLPAKHDAENLYAEIELPRVLDLLVAELPSIEEIYLFGSRRHRSGSTRSDIDLLIVGDDLPQPSVLAAIAHEIDSYLDVFVQRGSSAQSAVNESIITAADFEALRHDLDALLLWRRAEGWLAAADYRFVRVLAGFKPPGSMRPKPKPDPLVAKVDILFVSALSHEYTAIVSRFDRVISSPPGVRAQFQLGEIDAARRTRRVAACVSDRAGNLPAAITTYRGIEMFGPRLVVLVGITAGVKGEVELGDLIVPDTVVEYEATKVTPDGDEDHGAGMRFPLI